MGSRGGIGRAGAVVEVKGLSSSLRKLARYEACMEQ